ncbi:hypothetical protein BASA83_007784 [Batrachochytrium salamandrivorans]|nr:hypothetical protein BASA83_007784 [Batrachochytrium salamandrivorans]
MPEISGQNNGQTACSNPQATDSSPVHLATLTEIYLVGGDTDKKVGSNNQQSDYDRPGQTHQATINVPRTNQLLLSHAKQRASLNTSPMKIDCSKTGSIHLERRWIPPGIVSSNSDSYHPPPTASLDDFTPDFEDYVAPPNQVSNDGASYAAGYNSGYNAGYNAGYSAGLQVAQTSGICMVPGVRHHRHRHIRHNNPNAHQASLFRFSGRPTLFHQTGHPAHLHSTRHGGPGRHV